jgi:Protein of unknown function (DUF3275)
MIQQQNHSSSSIQSIQLQGTLIVRTRTGRHGPFCIGDLITSVGKFKVKDTIIDQYEQGQYKGIFVIEQIYVSSYTYNNTVISEMRATVSNIILDTQEDVPAAHAVTVELDPMDERAMTSSTPDSIVSRDAPKESSEPSTAKLPVAKKPAMQPNGEMKALSDEALFGDLYLDVKGSKPIALDSTIDREAFRLQRDRLKFLGYKFDATHQTWELPRAEQLNDSPVEA